MSKKTHLMDDDIRRTWENMSIFQHTYTYIYILRLQGLIQLTRTNLTPNCLMYLLEHVYNIFIDNIYIYISLNTCVVLRSAYFKIHCCLVIMKIISSGEDNVHIKNTYKDEQHDAECK